MKIRLNNELYKPDLPIRDSFELTYDFEGDILIGTELIASLDELFTKIKGLPELEEKSIINFIFYPINKQLDLGIFGILCLIKSTYKGVRVIFDLSRLGIGTTNEIAFKIKQYVASSYLFFENVIFEVKNEANSNKTKTIRHQTSWFKISNKYIPVFKVDQRFYEQAFLNRVSPEEIDSLTETFKQNPSEILSNKLSHSKYLSLSIEQYTSLCFFHMLEDLRLASFFTSATPENKIAKTSNKPWRKITGDYLKDYFYPVINILNNGLHHPCFFTLIFSKLLSNIITSYTTKPTEREINYKLLTSKVEEIFIISYVIFSGLREITANIIEHTSEKTGCLVGITKEELSET